MLYNELPERSVVESKMMDGEKSLSWSPNVICISVMGRRWRVVALYILQKIANTFQPIRWTCFKMENIPTNQAT